MSATEGPQVTVEVRLLGRGYLVQAPVSARADLEAAADELDRQLREIRDAGRVSGMERIAVMAALNLAHEVHTLRQQLNQRPSPELRERLPDWQRRVSETLEILREPRE